MTLIKFGLNAEQVLSVVDGKNGLLAGAANPYFLAARSLVLENIFSLLPSRLR